LGNSLQVTQEAIDIVRPGSGGSADQTHTILTPDADGRLGQVWIDTGKTGNPAAIKVDTTAPSKPKSEPDLLSATSQPGVGEIVGEAGSSTLTCRSQ